MKKPNEIGITLNKDLVLKGIEHVFTGNAELTEEETRQALEQLDVRVSTAMQAQAEEKSAAAEKAGHDFKPNLHSKKA